MLGQLGVLAHTFNPSTCEVEAVESEFKVTLVHKASSKIARGIQKNSFSLKTTTKEAKKRC